MTNSAMGSVFLPFRGTRPDAQGAAWSARPGKRGVAGWMIVLDRQNRLLWDHWDVVKPGILYRSGQLTSAQLTEAVGGTASAPS